MQSLAHLERVNIEEHNSFHFFKQQEYCNRDFKSLLLRNKKYKYSVNLLANNIIIKQVINVSLLNTTRVYLANWNIKYFHNFIAKIAVVRKKTSNVSAAKLKTSQTLQFYYHLKLNNKKQIKRL